MATKNFFDLLGDNENEDPSQVVVRANPIPAEFKPAVGMEKQPAALIKVQTKSAPPAEAVKDIQRVQYDGARGGLDGCLGGRDGRGNYGDRDGVSQEGGGYRERIYNYNSSVGQARDIIGFIGARSPFVEKPVRTEDGEGRYYEGNRGGARGRSRGGRGQCEGEERPRRREFDRQSGNARGNEIEKRAGAGRGNWGTDVDPAFIWDDADAVKTEESPAVEGYVAMKPKYGVSADATIEGGVVEAVKEEEEQDNEMTLEEYEKVLEEKRKALESEKASERKVVVDKSFENMQLVDNKKREEDIFIKLGQDKEKVKKEAAEREEKVRKPVSINEFLKPAEGEKYHGPSSNRGRGSRGGRGERRDGGGHGDRDFNRGNFGGGGGRFVASRAPEEVTSAPRIEDQAQFPTLGGK